MRDLVYADMKESLTRYSKIVAIRALSLTDADLGELQRIVVEGIRTDESVRLAITSYEGDKTAEVSSIESLVDQLNRKTVVDSLRIDFFFHGAIGGPEATEYVSIELHRNCAVESHFYVSSADQTWTYGKVQLLATFFRRKRVWYWGIVGEHLPWFLSWMLFIQLTIPAYSLVVRHSVIGTIVSVLSLVVSAFICVLAMRAVLFPGFTLSRVTDSKPSLVMNQGFWTAVAAIATVVGSVAGIVAVILQLLR